MENAPKKTTKKPIQKTFPWWSKKTPLKKTKIIMKSMSDLNLLKNQ